VRAEVRQSDISMIERGRLIPTSRCVDRLAGALNVAAGTLLHDVESVVRLDPGEHAKVSYA
jgi:ribosome-binding protein aMBF1 (putative translation factor)